jgi:hypothetical protein
MRAGIHVAETAQPDEAIRIVQVAKLSDHNHAGCFLTFNKVPFEKRDQHFAPTGHESVLPKFHHGTAASAHSLGFREVHRPIRFPRFSSIVGERLLPVRRRRLIPKIATRIGLPLN